MICRVIKAYGPWSVGRIFTDMPGNAARTLIARGLIEEVAVEATEPAAPEEKLFASPVDRMMSGGIKKAGRK